MSGGPSPSRQPGRATRFRHDVIAGLIASLLPLANCFTFAALIFSGPWLPMLSQGVTMLLISGAVTAVAVALTSGFRTAVAGPVALTSVLLAAMLVRLAPDLAGHDVQVVIATGLVALGVATLVTGAALLAMGALHLGKVVRFTPYPVIAGFMGATGWVMAESAVQMTTDVRLTLASLPQFADPVVAGRLFGLLGFTAFLAMLARRFRQPLAVPLAMACAAIAIDGTLRLSGMSFAAARAAGLLFDVRSPAPLAFPILSGVLTQADWGAVLRTAPSFALVAVLGVVQALVAAASLEIALDTDVDLDREMQSQGLANLASAVAGGTVGFTSTSYTSASMAAQGSGRLTALVIGAVMLAALSGGSALISFIPRVVLSGMLLMIGVDLLWRWGIASRRQLGVFEWVLTVAMITITATLGYLPALLAGLIGSCVLLAVSLSRMGVVRHSYGLNEASSALQRSDAEMKRLALEGGRARIIELGGLLFFGSAHQLLAQVKSAVAQPGVHTLVLDFSAVIGVDASAVSVLGRIRTLAEKAEARLIVSGLRADPAPLIGGTGRQPALIRGTLDEAIETAEDGILSGLDASIAPPPMQAWLAEALGGADMAEALFAQLEIGIFDEGDVLCREGEVAETMFFVGSGRVSVLVRAGGGPAIRVRVFGAHTIAGELGFLLGAVRNATLQIERRAQVGLLSRRAFAALSAAHPAVVVALFGYLARVQAERLSFATRQVVALRR